VTVFLLLAGIKVLMYFDNKGHNKTSGASECKYLLLVILHAFTTFPNRKTADK